MKWLFKREADVISVRAQVYKFVYFHSLLSGGGIVTSRAHTHYLVTEYGIAYLFGKSLRQRAHALIQIAHPDHREFLERQAFERLKCMPSP